MTLIITDQNWQQTAAQQFGVLPRPSQRSYGSPEAREYGLTPFSDSLDQLIPWDEMKERVNQANEQRQMPIHHLEAAEAKPHNQARTNLCWAYGLSLCDEAARLMGNQVYQRLGPPGLAWLVNYRNRGYYLSSTIKGAMERGIPRAEFCPDGVYQERDFKAGWEADALQYKPLEFTDLDRSTEKLMAQHCATVLVAGDPIYVAYNYWGHALAKVGVVWDETVKYRLRWIDWNSHNDGRIEMTGSRGIPDEGYAVRSVTIST